MKGVLSVRRLVCLFLSVLMIFGLGSTGIAHAYEGTEQMKAGDADVVQAILLNLLEYSVQVLEEEAEIVLDIRDPDELFLDLEVEMALMAIPVYGPILTPVYSYGKMTAEALWELGNALADANSAARDLMDSSFSLAANCQNKMIGLMNNAYQLGIQDHGAGHRKTDAEINEWYSFVTPAAPKIALLRESADSLVFLFNQKDANRIRALADALEVLDSSLPSLAESYRMGYAVAEALAEKDPVPEGKTQYRYHMYVNENGARFVCPYAGAAKYPGTTFQIVYTDWLDAPLPVNNGSYSYYVHAKTDACTQYGCIDPSWEGNRYMDSSGKTWVCQETRVAPLNCTHAYDTSCDPECNLCGYKRAVRHRYQEGICTICKAEDPDFIVWGDADGNRNVDYMDAMLVLRHAVQLKMLSEAVQGQCDVDQNNTIDYLDAMLILRKAVKLIDRLPIAK